MDPGFGGVDWEDPAVAGRIPVELVIILEEADLAGRTVADYVTMLADGDISVGVAELDPHAIADRARRSLDRVSVDRCSLEGEGDVDLTTSLVTVSGREIAEDAMVDPIVLGTDVDRFGDFDRRVPLDLDVAPEMENPLVSLRRRGGGEQEQGKQCP